MSKLYWQCFYFLDAYSSDRVISLACGVDSVRSIRSIRVGRVDMSMAGAGQEVTWLEQRKWGGKQNHPAVFLKQVGLRSARIAVDGVSKTVRLSSLRWHAEQGEESW